MDKTVQITLEVGLYLTAVLVHAVTSFPGFLFVWITLIIASKKYIKDPNSKWNEVLFACAVGNPIGILVGMAIRDMYHYPDSVCILVGCLVAISAEQILTGGWQTKVLDALIEKLKR